MLRDKNLVPFSHQHQHALALCVRIQRAIQSGEAELRHWQSEINSAFEHELESHFEAEEQILFPPAMKHAELRALVSELAAEHIVLRSYNLAGMAFSLERRDLAEFAATLSAHVRKEEQELFESLQDVLSPEELGKIGDASAAFFRGRVQG